MNFIGGNEQVILVSVEVSFRAVILVSHPSGTLTFKMRQGLQGFLLP